MRTRGQAQHTMEISCFTPVGVFDLNKHSHKSPSECMFEDLYFFYEKYELLEFPTLENSKGFSILYLLNSQALRFQKVENLNATN